MSHVVKVKLFVTDLNALAAAGARLGLTLNRDQKTWSSFYGNQKCSHALRLNNHQKGDYEIGLIPRSDGHPGFEMTFDEWGVHGRKLTAAAGAGLSTLKREMAAEVSTRILQRQGYRVSRVAGPDGGIKLRGHA